MRFFLVLTIFFCFSEANAQNCTPNINVKVNVCGISFSKDSLCPACGDCPSGLRASDSSFSIISYKLRWDAAARHIKAPGEVINIGAGFNEAKIIIDQLRPGLFLEFSCIKAKDKNGRIYILQPLTLQL